MNTRNIISAVRDGGLREEVENSFGRWASFVYSKAWTVIVITAVIVFGLATQLPKVEIETTNEGFLHEDDPVRIGYNNFRHQYGRDDKVLFLIEAPDIFDMAFLEKLRDFHRDIEEGTPMLEEVDSLLTARDTSGHGDELHVQGLFEDWPANEEQLAAIRERAIDNPILINTYLSEDQTLTAVMVETQVYSRTLNSDDLSDLTGGFDEEETPKEDLVFITGDENAEIVKHLVEISEKYDGDGFKIYTTGTPYMAKVTMDIMRHDMGMYTGFCVLIIAVLLTTIYRRSSMVILPLAVSILAMASTIGIMAGMGMRLSNSVQIMPSFLIAVGVGNSVHIFTVFYQAIKRGLNKHDALVYALEHAGLAILMTSLTTAGGLLSFTVSDVKVVYDFGTITPIGVIVTLIFSLVFLPALITVSPINTDPELASRRNPIQEIVSRVLDAFSKYSSGHPLKVLSVWAVLIGGGIFFGLKAPFSHDPVGWFDEEHPFFIAMEKVGNNFGGTTNLEVLLHSNKVDGFKDPEMLRKLEEIQKFVALYTQGDIYVTKTMSIVDINKEIHKALHDNSNNYYKLPESKQLIAQELLLFENSGADDLENVIDTEFKSARLTIKMPTVDAVIYPEFEDNLIHGMNEILNGDATIEFTGLLAMMGRVMHNLTFGLAQTYMLAFLVITPLMIILIGSLKMGLLSMIPNLAPIIVTLGVMGIFQMPLDISTLMVGSVALGLAVDDTIHFMHSYQRFYLRHGNNALAIQQTLETTGQALFFTTISLSCAFLVYLFSQMGNLVNFGLLTSFCVSMAFLSDVTLAPALVTMVSKTRKEVPEGEYTT